MFGLPKEMHKQPLLVLQALGYILLFLYIHSTLLLCKVTLLRTSHITIKKRERGKEILARGAKQLALVCNPTPVPPNHLKRQK